MALVEILPMIGPLPALEKLHLIRSLAEELDTNVEIYPFEHHKTYLMPIPYDMFGAGQALATSGHMP